MYCLGLGSSDFLREDDSSGLRFGYAPEVPGQCLVDVVYPRYWIPSL